MSGALSIALLLTLAASGPGNLACPATVQVGPSVIKAPPGWEAGTRTSEGMADYTFSMATFSIGHPSGLGFVIPSAETVRSGDTWDIYEFQGATDDKGVWLVCAYKDTPAYVAKRIEGQPKKCESPRTADAENAAVCE
jgi:hypothetical protein